MQVIWQSLQKAIREDNWRIWLQYQWPSSWGSAPAQLGLVGRASTNTGSFRVGSSRCWPRQALLRNTCYHSCNTDSVRLSKRFNAFEILGSDDRFHFLLGNEISIKSARSCCRPKQHPSLSSILQSFIGLWVKIWQRNKTADSKLSPVQSSRSKSTTCPRKGRLLRFE